ncbi:MAG: mercuric ion binding protein [Flavobacteriales bacterium]|jgi:mercuric ion binding protein
MKKSILKVVMSAFLGVLMMTSCGSSEETNNSSESMSKTEFKVYGNCGMCETTIEGSLNGQDGIGKADWDKETKLITVSYNPETIDEGKIKAKIAEVGYDTDSHRAKESVYSQLPRCCQYTRPE